VFDKNELFLGKYVLEVRSGYILINKDLFLESFSIWIRFHSKRQTGAAMLCRSVFLFILLHKVVNIYIK